MQLENSFTVPAAPDAAWDILLDVPRIAPCMPGAELTETVGEHSYKGNAKLRVGPVALTFSGEATITELAEPHRMSMPAVLKHVNRLVDAGLVTREKQGRTVICSLNIDPLDEANAWLQQNLDAWNSRFDALDAYLARQRKETP